MRIGQGGPPGRAVAAGEGGGFSAVLEKATGKLAARPSATGVACTTMPLRASAQGPTKIPCAEAAPLAPAAQGATKIPCAEAAPLALARGAVELVAGAQARLDAVLRLAERGSSLSPAALLAMQADVYRASQILELAGKVVERATSGVKQVLTTQL